MFFKEDINFILKIINWTSNNSGHTEWIFFASYQMDPRAAWDKMGP